MRKIRLNSLQIFILLFTSTFMLLSCENQLEDEIENNFKNTNQNNNISEIIDAFDYTLDYAINGHYSNDELGDIFISQLDSLGVETFEIVNDINDLDLSDDYRVVSDII